MAAIQRSFSEFETRHPNLKKARRIRNFGGVFEAVFSFQRSFLELQPFSRFSSRTSAVFSKCELSASFDLGVQCSLLRDAQGGNGIGGKGSKHQTRVLRNMPSRENNKGSNMQQGFSEPIAPLPLPRGELLTSPNLPTTPGLHKKIPA